MKVERVSYDAMTPSSARGILEAIHWKPAIRWVVDEIAVLKPIRFTSMRRNEVSQTASSANARRAMKSGDISDLALRVDEERQQRASTILADVDYVISAHFVRTGRAGADDTEGKHLDMFNRRAERGQCFHQPCLGTREFDADFSLVPPGDPAPEPLPEHRTPELGFGVPRELGIMLWDIEHDRPGRPSAFFRARLVDGVMAVPRPDSAQVLR